jgi:biopolymer transport protein ExbB
MRMAFGRRRELGALCCAVAAGIVFPAQAFAAPANAVSRSEPFLSWMVRASGPIGVVILAMSFYLVAVVVWMFRVFRRPVVIPDGLVKELEEHLAARRFTLAFGILKDHPSFLARVLTAGVRKLPSGIAGARRSMEFAAEQATMEMEHRATYLATVGTLGPMIGLVGTVYGMIMSFRVIATEGASPQATDLAAGISTSLFATLEGIALSVPAIAFYAFFRNRIARLSLDVALVSDSLLDQFAAGMGNPHPLAASRALPNPPARESG